MESLAICRKLEERRQTFWNARQVSINEKTPAVACQLDQRYRLCREPILFEQLTKFIRSAQVIQVNAANAELSQMKPTFHRLVTVATEKSFRLVQETDVTWYLLL